MSSKTLFICTLANIVYGFCTHIKFQHSLNCSSFTIMYGFCRYVHFQYTSNCSSWFNIFLVLGSPDIEWQFCLFQLKEFNDKNIVNKQLFSLGHVGVGCFSQSVGYVTLLTVHTDLQFFTLSVMCTHVIICYGLNREMIGDVPHIMRLSGDVVTRLTIGLWSWAKSSLTAQPKVPRLARWVMQG